MDNKQEKIRFTQRMRLTPVQEIEIEELYYIWIQPEVRKYL